jgi:arylsulfatase B
MKKLILLSWLCLIGIQVSAQRSVILLIADDIGTDYFGFYEDHGDTVDVPHIRSLLGRGVRFSNATSNPVCSSTRAGILTGRYSFRTGVGNIVGGVGGSGVLDTAELTIPRQLKRFDTNIGTANIGKWHLHLANPVSNLLNPNVLGYDHFEGPFLGALPSYTNWSKYTNGVVSTVTNYATSENVDNAVTWAKTQAGKPFFLWLAFNAPHSPYHLPPAALHSYTTLSGTSQDINANPKPYFKASLQALDTEIGRLMDSLQVLGRLDSTDFIFIGDNGNTIRTAQIADTSRAKGTIYQYGVHVPFIIAGPSVVNPGRVSDALVNTADIYATVLELFIDNNWQAQVLPAKPVDTKSLMPILLNQANQVRPWSFCEIFKLTPDADDGKAMRNMDYKLLRFDAGQEEFYNLASDPSETINLLNGTLNPSELLNYQYLCGEMTTLIGNGNFCTQVGIAQQATSETPFAYPNPFVSQLYLGGEADGGEVQLFNGLGQIVYQGNALAQQDFSNLPAGIYSLRIVGEGNPVLQLVKAAQ